MNGNDICTRDRNANIRTESRLPKLSSSLIYCLKEQSAENTRTGTQDSLRNYKMKNHDGEQ